MAKIAKFKEGISESWVRGRLWDLISNAFPFGESALCGVPNLGLADPADITYFSENFVNNDSLSRLNQTKDGSPTAGIEDAVGGVAKFVTTTTKNDENYYHTAEVFKFEEGKPLWFEARFKCVEKDTNKLGGIIGIMSAWGTNALVDNDATPATTFDGFVFYKKSGTDLKLRLKVSKGSTQVDKELCTYASNTFYKVGVFFNGKAEADNLEIWVDDVNMGTATLSLATPTEVGVGFGVKTTSSDKAEEFYIDYVTCVQLR